MTAAYLIIPALYRRPGERVPEWVCACPGLAKRKRHADPRQCLTREEVTAWRRAHPDATCGDSAARALLWLEREFGR